MKYFRIEGPIHVTSRKIVVKAESEEEAWNLWNDYDTTGELVGESHDSDTELRGIEDTLDSFVQAVEITKEQADAEKY